MTDSVPRDPQLSSPIDPDGLVRLADPMHAAFDRAGFTATGILEALGEHVHAALGRAEPAPVRRRCRNLGELGVLIRLFLVSDDVPVDDVRRALRPLDVGDAVATGILEVRDRTVRSLLDIRPLDLGVGNRWVVSDLDGSTRDVQIGSDHVLGVGHASLSLVRGTPTRVVGAPPSVLDLGTGCGIQALHAEPYAHSITATDVSDRAIALTRMTAALNHLEFETACGSWFEPVAGRTFDRIVANPPFVVGSGAVAHSYRDSGLDLDGASRLVIGTAPEHLAPGGVASLLASWVHVDGEDWRARVASWLPDHGVDAWIVQRDVADPELYVGTWLRDGGADLRDGTADETATAWLDHLEASSVTGIGFGFVYLRATDRPTSVLAEDLTHGFEDPLGNEALDVFDRLDWLRTHDVLDERFVVAPTTALEDVAVPAPEYDGGETEDSGGWTTVVRRVHRGDGPAWQHEIDEDGAALLAGMRADGLSLGELTELLAAARGRDAEELGESVARLVAGLVVHGLVLPASFAS